MIIASTCVLPCVSDSICFPKCCLKCWRMGTFVSQTIGAGKCLRLTPKELAQIRTLLKKKSDNSSRNGFLKKHVQLAFAWHVYILIIQRQAFQNYSFESCSLSSYSSWKPFDFTLSSLDAATSERDWLVSKGRLTLWIDHFAN